MTDQELVELFWQRRGGGPDRAPGQVRGLVPLHRRPHPGGRAGRGGVSGGLLAPAVERHPARPAPALPGLSGVVVRNRPCSSAGGGDGRGTRSLWPLWSWLSASPAGRGPRSRPRRRSWGGPSPPSWESWGRGRVPPSCGGTGTQTPWRRPPGTWAGRCPGPRASCFGRGRS